MRNTLEFQGRFEYAEEGISEHRTMKIGQWKLPSLRNRQKIEQK